MATSSLGRLTLDLAVRLSEFTEGMSRAERETADRTRNMRESVTAFRENLANELGGTQLGSIIDSFNSRFGSMEGSITKVGAAFAGIAVGGIAVGIGALSKLAIETAKADAQMAVFANRANTSVANFQALATASEGLGVNQEQLASILADTQEKLGEFSATAGGGAADFFNALKDNTKMTDDQIKAFGKTLTGKDGIEAIQLIKNKLDELGASAQEQRFVFESLGSDLGNLSVIFANGGSILNQYRDALEEAGVIKTKEAIEQSQLLAAQTQSVKQRFDGFKSQLAGAMMPVLNSLAQHFLSSSEKGGQLGGIIQGVSIIAKGAAAIILTFSTAVGVMGNTIGATLAQLGNIATTAMNVWNADGLEAKAQAIADGFRNAKNMTGDWWSTTLSSLRAADKTMGDLVNGQVTSADKFTQANLAIARAQNQQTNGLKLNTKEAEANRKEQEKLNKEKEKGAKLTQSSISVAMAAAQDVGVSEANNPNKIMGYQRAIGYMANRIDAWCGSFVGASLLKAGFAVPKGGVGASARSWEKYGASFNKNGLIPSGAIATVARNGGSGRHVFIVEKDLGNGKVATIEGNVGDKVVRNVRNKSQIITVRIPITADGRVANTGNDSKSYNDLSRLDDMRDSDLQKKAQDAQKAAEERQRQLEQDARDRQSLAEKYYTEEQRINAENEKNMADINRLYVRGTKEYHDALLLENERYLKAYSEYEWKLGEKARAQLALIDKIKDDIGSSTMQSTNDYLDASMKASMSPEQYNKWSMQRDYNNQYSSLYGQYENRQNEINAKDDQGNFRIDSETERNVLLEQARQEHLAKMYVMEADYATKVTDLDKQQAEARSQSIGNMFSTMTGAAATFFGQQSAMYRAAFAMEKAYAVYKAVMNIRETYSNTYNSVAAIPVIGPYIAAPTAAAAAAVQVAQAAQLRSMQAPSVGGIAHGGLDYVPKETTFLLDEGERVLSPRQNKDLTRYLNERQNTTGGNVNVYNNSSAQVTAERQPNGEVTIEVVDKMIKRSWGKVAQANSFESRQIQKHTTARFNRQ